MTFLKVIYKLIIYAMASTLVVSSVSANDNEYSTRVSHDVLLPLKLKQDKDLVLKKNKRLNKPLQKWYSIWDKQENPTTLISGGISLVEYTDKQFALKEYKELAASEHMINATSSLNDVDFCLYRFQQHPETDEESIFLYLGIDRHFFLMHAEQKLLHRAFDLNYYCGIAVQSSSN